MKKTYFIHNNFSKPYKVIVKDDSVSIYQEITNYSFSTNNSDVSVSNPKVVYSKKPLMNFENVKKIFIGKSLKNEMTTSSGSYGSKFDGNSILVNVKADDYIYIGHDIFSFKSFSEIIHYESPVGNNYVPYPYAIDIKNNYYLMIEDVVLINDTMKPKDKEQPYWYYYDLSSSIEKKIKIKEQPIKGFYIGGNKYDMSYYSRPHQDYDRIKKWKDFGDGMKFILKNKKEYKINRKEYIRIMKSYGKDNYFKHLKGYKLLYKFSY